MGLAGPVQKTFAALEVEVALEVVVVETVLELEIAVMKVVAWEVAEVEVEEAMLVGETVVELTPARVEAAALGDAAGATVPSVATVTRPT